MSRQNPISRDFYVSKHTNIGSGKALCADVAVLFGTDSGSDNGRKHRNCERKPGNPSADLNELKLRPGFGIEATMVAARQHFVSAPVSACCLSHSGKPLRISRLSLACRGNTSMAGRRRLRGMSKACATGSPGETWSEPSGFRRIRLTGLGYQSVSTSPLCTSSPRDGDSEVE